MFLEINDSLIQAPQRPERGIRIAKKEKEMITTEE
jgi:hypothetical protein